MDNLKKLNLKKHLLSLKYCFEDLIIENKALSSHSHLLENLFKQTKNYAALLLDFHSYCGHLF